MAGKAGWCHVIAAYILIQTEDGKAAIMAAALRASRDTASVARPDNVTARARSGALWCPVITCGAGAGSRSRRCAA